MVVKELETSYFLLQMRFYDLNHNNTLQNNKNKYQNILWQVIILEKLNGF